MRVVESNTNIILESKNKNFTLAKVKVNNSVKLKIISSDNAKKWNIKIMIKSGKDKINFSNIRDYMYIHTENDISPADDMYEYVKLLIEANSFIEELIPYINNKVK